MQRFRDSDSGSALLEWRRSTRTDSADGSASSRGRASVDSLHRSRLNSEVDGSYRQSKAAIDSELLLMSSALEQMYQQMSVKECVEDIVRRAETAYWEAQLQKAADASDLRIKSLHNQQELELQSIRSRYDESTRALQSQYEQRITTLEQTVTETQTRNRSLEQQLSLRMKEITSIQTELEKKNQEYMELLRQRETEAQTVLMKEEQMQRLKQVETAELKRITPVWRNVCGFLTPYDLFLLSPVSKTICKISHNPLVSVDMYKAKEREVFLLEAEVKALQTRVDSGIASIQSYSTVPPDETLRANITKFVFNNARVKSPEELASADGPKKLDPQSANIAAALRQKSARYAGDPDKLNQWYRSLEEQVATLLTQNAVYMEQAKAIEAVKDFLFVKLSECEKSLQTLSLERQDAAAEMEAQLNVKHHLLVIKRDLEETVTRLQEALKAVTEEKDLIRNQLKAVQESSQDTQEELNKAREEKKVLIKEVKNTRRMVQKNRTLITKQPLCSPPSLYNGFPIRFC
eukprot:GILK01005332.1.p1 GENE.GILK01005332.1~~GILK01005332.1.p1  ORF type:complete len:520 (+),score=149.55 GILK01005332.1:60-1619(+)